VRINHDSPAKIAPLLRWVFRRVLCGIDTRHDDAFAVADRYRITDTHRFSSVAIAHELSPNAAVERPHAALSSAQQVQNEVTRLLRARDAASRSAPTAC